MPPRIELRKVEDVGVGEVVKPPWMVPVKTYRTIVEHGHVYLEA